MSKEMIGDQCEDFKTLMLKERDRGTMQLRPKFASTSVEDVAGLLGRLVPETESVDDYQALRAFLAIYGLQTVILETQGMELAEAEKGGE